MFLGPVVVYNYRSPSSKNDGKFNVVRVPRIFYFPISHCLFPFIQLILSEPLEKRIAVDFYLKIS